MDSLNPSEESVPADSTAPIAGETPSCLRESHSRLLPRFVQLLIHYRLVLLTLALLLTLLAYGPAQRLELERSIESLFAPGHPLLVEYQKSKAAFGGDEFVMLAWKQPELLTTSSLQDITQFAAQLNQLPGINPESTQTLSAVMRPTNAGLLGNLFMRIPSVQQRALHFAEGALIGEDRETTAIIVRLKPEAETQTPRETTFRQIRELAAARPYPTYVVGEPVQVHDMFEIVERDGATLGWASSAILLVIILFLFRSLRWMLLPILIVQVSLLWTRATLVLTGLSLSMVSSMLDSLVTIIGIATVMHLTILYRELRLSLGRRESLEQALADLLPAIFWTCATTAIGFGALMSSQIVPIQSFGLMMAIGTVMVLAAVVTIVPGAVLLGGFSVDPRRYQWEARLTAGLQKLLTAVGRFPRFIGACTFLLTVLGLTGMSFLKIETDFSKNFHESSSIVQSLQFVESHLGGAGNYEVNFPFASLNDPEALDQLRKLGEELRKLQSADQPAVTKVITYTDGIDFIPNIAARTYEDKQELLTEMQPEFTPSMFSADKGQMRILLRALERQPAEQKLELIEEVRQTTDQYFPGARCTGLYVLLANIIQSLLSDQLVSFLLATVGIWLMMTIAFRSWQIGLISLVPNLFPIIVLIGTLGWIGSLINIGTAMIACVSIGLTVDSSIHYLSAYQRMRSRGQSHEDSLQWTQQQVGLSLVFSNLALICGFSVLMLSEFVPLNYFGVLVSIALLGGLLGNIVLLPLLLTGLNNLRTT